MKYVLGLKEHQDKSASTIPSSPPTDLDPLTLTLILPKYLVSVTETTSPISKFLPV
jgi:hypothetical protein